MSVGNARVYCQCKCGCKLYGGRLHFCSKCGHNVVDHCCRAIQYEDLYGVVCYCHWCLEEPRATAAIGATAATGATSATGATAAACATAIAATDACVSTDQPALERRSARPQAALAEALFC